MTTTDEAAALEVTQMDREAAADYMGFCDYDWGFCGDVREGRVEHALPEAFARHRATERDRLLASQERAIADAVGLVVQYRDDLRHGLSGDSRDRRLVAITAFLALHSQEIK